MAAAPKSKPHSGPGADAAPGLAVRRIAAEIVDGVLRRNRSLDEQLDGAGANAGLAGLSDRDRALTRALVATVVRRLGTLRHLIGIFRRAWPAEGGAAHRVRALDRRGADSFPRRARSCRRRSRRPSGAGGSLRRPPCRSGQRRAPPCGARRRRAFGGARHGRPRHAGMADGALDRDLRREHRPHYRHRQWPRAGARSDGEKRSGALGHAARRAGLADRLDTHDRARHRDGAAGFCRRRMVGSGRGRGVAGASPWRRCRASRRRSLRGAGRQGRATRRRRRSCHRRRSFAGAARPAGGESQTSCR